MFAGSRRAEQLSLRSQQRVVATAEQGATCSPLDHNAGKTRRRERVCFPGGASIKALLCIDARCTRQYDVFLVDGPSISLGS